MNKIIIDFPEQLQQNAFAVWMENKGFELFQQYYASKMPNEIQPTNSECEFDYDGSGKHYITIE